MKKNTWKIQNTKVNEYFCKSFFMGILTHEDETTMLTANGEIRLSRDVIFQTNVNPNAFSLF